MPELPEVETVKGGLEKALLGQRVRSVSVFRSDLRVPVPDDFCKALAGCVVTQILRRGKYIVGVLDSGRVFILHLGMSGRVRIYGSGLPAHLEKHDHVTIEAENGTGIVYHDPRRFGFLILGQAESWEMSAPFDRMGPEPLAGNNVFNGAVLHQALAGRKGPIKTALLDQSVVAGLGNIYVCEALYDSGIAPERSCALIDETMCVRLAESIRTILLRAVAAGGSTLRDYQKTDGSLGYFQYSFSVYDREGERCGGCDCAEGSVVRTVQAGRSTFACPVKQV